MGLFSFESKQVKEWKKLAKSGDMEAQYHLARAYANGKGASINMKRAVDYCVQSAEQEYAPAQALLAHFYGYGKGVDKNYEEMIHWGEKAALQGYAQAQNNVGRCYEQGKGKEKDFEKANRKKFCARIATGEYDAVIIGQSQFERIPLSVQRQKDTIQAEIEQITEAIEQTKWQRGSRFTVGQLEKTKKSLQINLEKLANEDKKDNVVTFEE